MAKNAQRYEIRWAVHEDGTEHPYVVLIGGNGEILFTTEEFTGGVHQAHLSIAAIAEAAQTVKVITKTRPSALELRQKKEEPGSHGTISGSL